MDDEHALPPVSTTAVGVAAIRAAEAARPDALFSDPFADSFARAAGFSPNPRTDSEWTDRVAAVITWVRVRTRFLDDLLVDACAKGCRQVVILGAGLDARAFRLDWPAGVRLFELDLDAILAFKERVVRSEGHVAACDRVVVPTDLTGDWALDLQGAGFDPARPTVWIAEGLLVYLTDETRDAVVDRLTTLSATASRFGLTLASADRRPPPRADAGAIPSQPGDYMALWQSEPPADAVEWLAPRGWEVEVFDAYERAGAYGLDVTATAVTRRHTRLIEAARR